MYLKFKAFSYILIGVAFLGISLGVVLGAYFKSNEDLDSYLEEIYTAS